MLLSQCSRRITAVLVCLLLVGATRSAHANPSLLFEGLVRTINTGGSITLSSPSGIVVDSAGDIFIADTVSGAGRIVEVNAQGAASVLTVGVSPALGTVSGIAIDGLGNLYVVDTGHNRVVEVSASGAGTVIGTGSLTLNAPQGVALDQSGNIFISDGTGGSSRIVEVASGGAATVLSITVSTSPTALSSPEGLAVDASGNLYIADTANSRIVKVAAGGPVGVSLGNGGLADPGLTTPSGVAVDRIGNIYIADTGNSRIVEMDTSGVGTILSNFLTDQYLPLNSPMGIAVDAFGAVYIANTDDSNAVIVDPGTIWDGLNYSWNRSAVGFGHISLGSSTPTSLILNFKVGAPLVGNLGSVNVFTAGTQGLDFQIVSGANTTCNSSSTSDSNCTVEVSFLPTAPGLRNGQLVLYDPDSNPVLTVPLYGFGDAPVAALAPNRGTVINTGGVPLSFPFQIALDGAGNIYDANDGGNLLKIPAGGGTASVVSPTGYPFGEEVTGVALDGAGNLFISDHDNNRILVITPGGVASVLSIPNLSPGLSLPTALAFDASGTLYIADYGTGRTVEVSSLQVTGATSTGIGTVIGTGSYTVTPEGNTGVAVDSMGNVYITDGYLNSDPSRIIKVTAAGVASLLTPTGITLNSPQGVGVDAMGNIYVADGGNNRIVEITTAGVASVLKIGGLTAPATLSFPFGVTVDPFGNLYIADSGNGRAVFVNVSGSALTYANTLEGQTSSDSPKTATVTNLGNQPLVFSANPTYTLNFSSNGSDTNPCTSSTALSPGTLCDVSVNFTPQSVGSLSAGITVTNNALNVAGNTQQVSVSGMGLVSSDSTSTVLTINPASLVSGQPVTLTATVADTATGHTANSPTGPVTFTDTVGSTVTSLDRGSSVNLNNKTASLTGVVLSGIGTHTLTAHYAGISEQYGASSGSVTVVLSKASVTVTGPATQPVSLAPGQTGSVTITVTAPYTSIAVPSGSLNYTILNNATGTSVASGTLTLSAGSGSSTATVLIPSSLAPGSYSISITYSGDGNYAVTPTATTISLHISQATPTVTLTSSASSVVLTNPLVFTATVSSPTTTPTGTVSFLDGATPLGQGSLAKGVATLSTSSLTAGIHTITAVYSGDANFSAATSGALTESVLDFALSNQPGSGGSNSAPPSQTVAPGGTATYPLTILPTNGTIFPAPITLSLTGLPSGATASIAPSSWTPLTSTTWAFPANSALPATTLAIQTPSTVARLHWEDLTRRTLPPVLLGVLLLPFGWRRRLGARLRRPLFAGLLLVAAMAAMVGLSGCGASSGFFGQAENTYPITVTATSGTLSHSTTVTLTVE